MSFTHNTSSSVLNIYEIITCISQATQVFHGRLTSKFWHGVKVSIVMVNRSLHPSAKAGGFTGSAG